MKILLKPALTGRFPLGNAYWNNYDTYINFSVRFLSIPFWLEICNRLKIVDKEVLLSDLNFSIMERMLHFSEEEELGLISYEECIKKCQSVNEVASKLGLDNAIADKLDYLVHYYPGYKSLRRGNFLLYYTLLLSGDLKTVINTAELLIDLIICGCIIDDLNDVDQDALNNEDNIIIELGNDLDALNEAKKLFETSKLRLIKLFPELDIYFNKVLLQSVFTYITKNNEKSISK
jgi:hypothetical protein